MAGKKKFINPLTRSSVESLNLPVEEENRTEVKSVAEAPENKRKEESFEARNQRFTTWVDKDLKRQFDELAKKRSVSKTVLLNEAIATLLHKEDRKPYTRRTDVNS